MIPWNKMMHELSGKNFPAEEHPRLLLISSRVPAAEVGNFEFLHTILILNLAPTCEYH